MLVRKSWRWGTQQHWYVYEGWFLFGVLPLYIVRNGLHPTKYLSDD